LANWKKAKIPAVTEPVERVAELPFLPAHRVLDLGPGGDEGQADDSS
jgi:hypothetical protein